MSDLQRVILTSLQILFVWVAMQPGGVLHWLQQILGAGLRLLPIQVEMWLHKPLFYCLTCMASVWGLVFTADLFAFSWHYACLLMAVSGLNYIIEFSINVFNSDSTCDIAEDPARK